MALMMSARIDVYLMSEFLADGLPRDASSNPDWRWLTNAPKGPSQAGIDELQAAQREHGFEHVTTGDARPADPRHVGIYVRVEQ